ncbi:MAG: oligopeptidase A [Pseudomonadales bacterium]
MKNPLLSNNELPPFATIKPEHIEPAITQLIEESLSAVDQLLKTQQPSWASLLQPLENLEDNIQQAWSPVGHLNGVAQNDALRVAYDSCLPRLSEYHTRLAQNAALFTAYQQLQQSDEFADFSTARQKVIANALRDFRLSGIDLPADKQQRFADIKKRLAELASDFSNNVLDATQAWSKLISNEAELAGVPETALNAARVAAKNQNKEGFLLTLDAPCYLAVVTYAGDSELRKEMYSAYTSRASELGPNACEYDNSANMVEILGLRREMAQLLGFASYADYSLATKMAPEIATVLGFLNELAEKSRPNAEQELAELKHFAAEQYSATDLAAWDIAYYSEKLRQHKYAVSQEELRPFFPAAKVLEGLFAVTARLFNVSIEANGAIETWHADAKLFDVYRDRQLIARFYIDLYARENKRGGAWMDECRVRRKRDDGSTQLPVAYLTCNFMAPAGSKPSLLTFNEVTTLFHEFGHGLHHMLTEIDCAGVSGINGVEWDAVELPSQFLENWCWQKSVIPLISSHYETGEPLPESLLDKLLAAKNFQSGMQMLRQIEFALFDFELHQSAAIDSADGIQTLLNEVRERVAVLQPPPENRFQHGFSHIFAGGYAAGYYSYKWAEVLAADAFAVFEEKGIFDPATGREFLNKILSKGGSIDALDLFKSFRGREPQVDALLRHAGIG